MTDKSKDTEKKQNQCKHRSLEMDESTGMWVCQDCFTTITHRLKYTDDNAPPFTM